MNIKISKKEHDYLLNDVPNRQFLFGSRLFETHTEKSDYDYLCIYDFSKLSDVPYSVISAYPNIHSFQYDDKENNKQYIWMSAEQFHFNLRSGDGTILSDVILFNNCDENDYNIVRTTKVIRAYCGVAKRDMKLHAKDPKKRFHARKSIYIANCLMDGEMPLKSTIQSFMIDDVGVKDICKSIDDSRSRINKISDDNLLPTYHINLTKNVGDLTIGESLVYKLVKSNNIKEFKY